MYKTIFFEKKPKYIIDQEERITKRLQEKYGNMNNPSRRKTIDDDGRKSKTKKRRQREIFENLSNGSPSDGKTKKAIELSFKLLNLESIPPSKNPSRTHSMMLSDINNINN